MFRASCLVALIVLQTGWVATAFADRAKDKWQEEILLQLSELRKAQGELAKQVSELKAQLWKSRQEAEFLAGKLGVPTESRR